MIQLFLATALAWAADPHAADGHHAVVIPWGSIWVQTFNFVLLIGLLTFLLRKSVKAMFANRATDYNNLVERASEAKREAERGHAEIKDRLDRLEMGAEENLRRARAEAAELKTKLLAEAADLTAKLETEAKRSVQVELDKAKNELRTELLENALQASANTLSTSISATEQKRLQNEFVSKIGEVH